MAADDGCSALEALPGAQLDLVICNAGYLANDTLETLNFQDCRHQFEVNALGPLRTVKAVAAKLGERSKILVIGSMLGSVGLNASGGKVRLRSLRPRNNNTIAACRQTHSTHLAARCVCALSDNEITTRSPQTDRHSHCVWRQGASAVSLTTKGKPVEMPCLSWLTRTQRVWRQGAPALSLTTKSHHDIDRRNPAHTLSASTRLAARLVCVPCLSEGIQPAESAQQCTTR